MGEPLRGHEGEVKSVAFSPDGLRIASGSSDTTIRLWDVVTGKVLGEPLRGHEREVKSVAFSPDGLRVASGSSDATIRLWDAVTGRPLGGPFRGHEGAVFAVAFSPDNSRVVSCSYDRTVRLWNVVTGQALGELVGTHQGAVFSVAFSPDGSRILSGSADQTIREWDADNSVNANASDQGHVGSTPSALEADRERTPLAIHIPGFDQCTLLWDGWVESSGKRLFWVPPDNRYGLQNPRLLLTMPTMSPFRATKLDFTRFQCGLSWTNVRTDTT